MQCGLSDCLNIRRWSRADRTPFSRNRILLPDASVRQTFQASTKVGVSPAHPPGDAALQVLTPRLREVLQREVKFKYPHAHSRGQETVPVPARMRTGIPHQRQLARTPATTLRVEVSYSLAFLIQSYSFEMQKFCMQSVREALLSRDRSQTTRSEMHSHRAD